MPVYTYRCENCQHEFDKYQSFSEEPLKKCPNCKKNALYKVYKPALVVFKGSGFYATDNRSASGNGQRGSTEDGDKAEKKKKTDKKSESKASDKSADSGE